MRLGDRVRRLNARSLAEHQVRLRDDGVVGTERHGRAAARGTPGETVGPVRARVRLAMVRARLVGSELRCSPVALPLEPAKCAVDGERATVQIGARLEEG